MIQGLRTKVLRPQVYALVITFDGGSYYSIQVAYSLEDAFGLAKKEMTSKNPLLQAKNIAIGQFDRKDLFELVEPFAEKVPEPVVQRIPPAPLPIVKAEPVLPVTSVVPSRHPVFDKLEAMRKIVATKDRKLFEQHMNEFSENERKYLEDKLGK